MLRTKIITVVNDSERLEAKVTGFLANINQKNIFNISYAAGGYGDGSYANMIKYSVMIIYNDPTAEGIN